MFVEDGATVRDAVGVPVVVGVLVVAVEAPVMVASTVAVPATPHATAGVAVAMACPPARSPMEVLHPSNVVGDVAFPDESTKKSTEQSNSIGMPLWPASSACWASTDSATTPGTSTKTSWK